MKTSSLILPLAALTLAAQAAPQAQPAAPTTATDAMPQPDSLTDADCVAIESFLLRASRAALLAYADAFEQALKSGDEESLARLVWGGRGSVIATAMAGESSEGLPGDFRQYLAGVFELMQQSLRKPESRQEMEQMLQQRDQALATLRQQYPRAAACLPPESILMPMDKACRDMKNDIWAHRGSFEAYAAELREIAQRMPLTMEAGAARRELMRQTLRHLNGIQPAAVAFGVGLEHLFTFPAGPENLGYRWQLAGELPADAPVSVSWDKETLALPLPAPGSGAAAPEQRMQVATVKGLRAGVVTLHFVFTRPGEAEPLFSCECEVEVMPPRARE